eukprot:g5794.t1
MFSRIFKKMDRLLSSGKQMKLFKRSYTVSSLEKIPSEIDVLIVGAGPCGLVLQGLLESSISQLSVLVVDSASGPTEHPQAHFLHQRTMEILRSLNPNVEKYIKEEAAPIEEWRNFVYCRSVLEAASEDSVSVDHFKDFSITELEKLSPCQPVHLPQTRLIPILLAELDKDSSVHYGLKLAGLKEEDSELSSPYPVTALLERTGDFASDSSLSPISVKCRTLVGCDGAHSAVRVLSGIGKNIPDRNRRDSLQHLVSIHFLFPRLYDLVKNNPAMLYFIYNADLVGVMVAHDLQSGESVLQVPYFPLAENFEESFSKKKCLSLIYSALGGAESNNVEFSDITIQTIRPWTVESGVSSQFVSRDGEGRIVLAGDSCHVMPPSGGLGMNTSIADAHALAWRLSHSLSGMKSSNVDDLSYWNSELTKGLQDYERERIAAAKGALHLSLENYDKVQKASSLLGASPTVAATAEYVSSTIPLPQDFRRSAFGIVMSMGRKILLSRENGAASVLGGWTRLKDRVNRGLSLPLLFPYFDLGFVYPTIYDNESFSTCKERILMCRNGARLPHAELCCASGNIFSTIDIVANARFNMQYTLFLGVKELKMNVRKEIEERIQFPCAVNIVRITKDFQDVKASLELSGLLDKISVKEISSMVDVDGSCRKIGLSDCYAVFVRPDGIVEFKLN